MLKLTRMSEAKCRTEPYSCNSQNSVLKDPSQNRPEQTHSRKESDFKMNVNTACLGQSEIYLCFIILYINLSDYNFLSQI